MGTIASLAGGWRMDGRNRNYNIKEIRFAHHIGDSLYILKKDTRPRPTHRPRRTHYVTPTRSHPRPTHTPRRRHECVWKGLCNDAGGNILDKWQTRFDAKNEKDCVKKCRNAKKWRSGEETACQFSKKGGCFLYRGRTVGKIVKGNEWKDGKCWKFVGNSKACEITPTRSTSYTPHPRPTHTTRRHRHEPNHVVSKMYVNGDNLNKKYMMK